MIGCHLADDGRGDRVPRREEIVESDPLLGHAFEPSLELRGDVLAARRQDLVHRPVVSQHVDDEGATKVAVDAFVGQQIAHVEQSRGCWRSRAATIFPANRSASDTTYISANPKRASTASATARNSGA